MASAVIELAPRTGAVGPVAAPSTVAASHAGSRRDVQGLRAVAVLAVVGFHAARLVPGGYTGVDVFFVISGFVITGSLAREADRTGRISLPRFYGRRVRRLLPALAVLLTTVAVTMPLLGPAATQRTGALASVFASVSAANLYLSSLPAGYFDAGIALNPLLHTWTLAVEEQFYLVFPFLLWLSCRVRARALAVLGVGVAVLTSFLYAVELSRQAETTGRLSFAHQAFYNPAARAWEFGLGALVALGLPLLARLSARSGRLLGLAGLGAIAIAFASPPGGGAPWRAALLPALGACAVIVSGTKTDRGAVRLLSTSFMNWIGDRSYALYLWHWPLIVFAVALWPTSRAAACLAAAGAFVPAVVSYAFVEDPIRRAGPRGSRVVVLAAVCISVPVCASLAALAVSSKLAHSAGMTSWVEARRLHADVTRGCSDLGPSSSRPARCTWHAPHAQGRLVLFGDSNAGQFTEPVVRAGTSAGYDVTVATHSSCPYVGDPANRSCTQFARTTLDELRRSRPDLVIMAARTDVYLARGGDTQERVWRQSLRAIVERLTRAGVPVVVIDPVPRLDAPTDGCAVIRVVSGSCGGSVSRARVTRSLAAAVRAERAGTSGVQQAAAISLIDDLCGSDRCPAMRDGIAMYRDDEHLSVQGACTLTERFARIIAAHARQAARQSPHAPRRTISCATTA